MESGGCVEEVGSYLSQMVFSKQKGGCSGSCINSKPR